MNKICRAWLLAAAFIAIGMPSAHASGEALDPSIAVQASRLGETHAEVCGAARAMAASAATFGELNDARDRVIGMLKDYVRDTPGVVSAWTVWEPDMFDGRDAEYINAPYHDATGRFIPQVAKAAGDISVQAAHGYYAYDSSYARTLAGKAYVSEPYYIGLTPVYTVSTPITRALQKVGALGVEVDLSIWANALRQTSLGSNVFMLSQSGVIAIQANSTAVETDALPAEASQQLTQLLKRGGSLNLPMQTGSGQAAVLNASAVDMGSGYWAVCSITPTTLQSGTTSPLLYLAIGLIVLAVGLGIGLLARRRDAQDLAEAMRQAAEGDVDVKAPSYPGGNRHLQAACFSFSNNIRLQRQHRQQAKALANGQYLRMHPASDKDETTAALNKTAGRMEHMQHSTDELKDKLDDTRAKFEARQRRIGQQLLQADDQLGLLDEDIAQGQQAMAEAAQRIAQASSRLADARRQAGQLTPALEDLNQRLAATQKQQQDMEAVLKALKDISINSHIISLNARIEAVKTDRPVFSALAEEMEEMSRRCARLHSQAARLLDQPEHAPADASDMLDRLLNSLDGAGQSLQDISIGNTDDGAVQTLRQVREALQRLSAGAAGKPRQPYDRPAMPIRAGGIR